MRTCSLIACLAFLALGTYNTKAFADCKPRLMAELPVTLIGLHPLITVQINGSAVGVVLDSGAEFNLLTYEAAAKLHLRLHSLPGRPTVSGVGGLADTLLSLAIANVRVGDARVAGAKFIVGGAPIGSAAGFIGDSILRNYDIDYDLAARVVKLVRADGCDAVAPASWANSQPRSVADLQRNASFHATGYVNGVETRIAFDTGASTSILDIRAAARAGVTPESAGAVPDSDVYGIGRGDVKTWVVPVSSIKIGDEEIRDTRVRIGNISLPEVDMVLGTDFFLSHHVYLSHSQQKVYFAYNGGKVFNVDPLQRSVH